ncbi:MAG TPA: bifunctional 4-hydroxy-2-oxoglutarate aldolase/2-dehydro-3-deoxy-phosphogluconate aldolase [Candidatus Angelobacter sp.]|nr:bifunctional 4-hydroxy-2-oxoglutarate aldolase/2-dehydro-3-deoxy-phosphogluconate aldolase [Candidatus Angelobacter sp.]
MNKEEVRKKIETVGIIPVVRASSSEEACMAAEAVRLGGIPIVEITMTVPGAVEVIAALSKQCGSEVLIGAGTVRDAEAARRCLDAGAQFLVSPGTNPKTIEFAAQRGVVMMAGALTPTEVDFAWQLGVDYVKVFPCSAVGGPSYIKALKGPFPEIPLVPTGGVNLQTAADFLKAGSAALGVGGELVQGAALKAKKPEIITETARKFVEIIRAARATS